MSLPLSQPLPQSACDLPTASSAPPPLSASVRIALARGQVVDAARLVRSEQHIELKEAKEQIDAYLKGQPAVRDHIDQVQTETREGLIRWLVFFAVGGAGLAYLLM